MFDGNVAVYNLQTANATEPIYMSRGIHGKHSDVVWEVKWGPDMPDGEINFYSVSADGCVFNWILMQSKLSITTIITLYLEREFVGGPDGNNIKLKGFFHPQLGNILSNYYLNSNKKNLSLNSMWYKYGFPSEAAKYFFDRHRGRRHIQVQHRIQFAVFDVIRRPLSASLSYRFQQIQLKYICFVQCWLARKDLGRYAEVCNCSRAR